MSITHEIYKSFEKGYEVRGLFLNISKAFDKVWHDVIIFKLTQNWISGNLLKLLRETRQSVFLNGQASRWENVTAGGPRFLGRCSIKQVGHDGWPTKKILSSRSSKTCLNHILCTVSLWSTLYGLSVAAFVMYASHNTTKTNVKIEFQKCINPQKHQVSNKFMTITSIWEKVFLFDEAF